MGTLMFWAEPNGFFNATLGRMLEKLRESKYVGYIDINCIANGKGIYPGSSSPRASVTLRSASRWKGTTSPMGEFLYALAKGEQYPLKVQKGFQVGSSSRRRRSRITTKNYCRCIKTFQFCSNVRIPTVSISAT